MKLSLSDISSNPNALAKHYSHFNVQNRILLTGHSHQAWPDCGFEGQKQAWLDAAGFVDDKWEIAFKKAELVRNGFSHLLDDPNGYIALGQNTHELLIRFLSALPLKQKSKIITTNEEFHTIRRQTDRLIEEGINIVNISTEEFDSVTERIIQETDENTAAVLVSKVFFKTGRILKGLDLIMDKCIQTGSELLVDVYHALNAIPFSIKTEKLQNAFIIGGGYKYCQLGEGNCFLRFPEDCNLKPVITGWFSEFSALSDNNVKGISYGKGADLFAGATYDPTSHYRAAEVFSFFREHHLTPAFLREINLHQLKLLADEFDKLDADPSVIRRDRNVPREQKGAFLVLNSPLAGEISKALRNRNVFSDFRGDVLRLGPAPYLNDEQLRESISVLGEIINSIS
ncbi:MAG: kynureninase [Ignavibacteriaceae bacterium]